MHYPVISVSHPPNDYQTDSSSVHIVGTVTDTTSSVSLTVNDQPVTLSPGGEFNHKVYLFPGDNYFILEAVNANDNQATLSRKIIRDYITGILPAPEEVAPPLDSTIVTTMLASTAFLFKGDSLIQHGVEDGIIEPRRASVVRGKGLVIFIPPGGMVNQAGKNMFFCKTG